MKVFFDDFIGFLTGFMGFLDSSVSQLLKSLIDR